MERIRDRHHEFLLLCWRLTMRIIRLRTTFGCVSDLPYQPPWGTAIRLSLEFLKFRALSLQHVTCLPASTQSYPLEISSGQVHYSPRPPLVASQLTQRKSHSPASRLQFSASRHTALFDIPGAGEHFAADASCLSEWSASADIRAHFHTFFRLLLTCH